MASLIWPSGNGRLCWKPMFTSGADVFRRVGAAFLTAFFATFFATFFTTFLPFLATGFLAPNSICADTASARDRTTSDDAGATKACEQPSSAAKTTSLRRPMATGL